MHKGGERSEYNGDNRVESKDITGGYISYGVCTRKRKNNLFPSSPVALFFQCQWLMDLSTHDYPVAVSNEEERSNPAMERREAWK